MDEKIKTTKHHFDSSSMKKEISYSDKIIGRGYCSNIYLGTFKYQPVAVKRIETDSVNNRNEERTLKNLNHPNIIKLFWAENQCQDKFRCSALELCATSMDKLFLPDYHEEKYRGPIPSELDGLFHMTEGLAYLHRIDVTHGDIKPQHILISLTDPPVMKLAGFGLAKKVSSKSDGSYIKKGVINGAEWTAPEILKLLHEQSNQINRADGTDVIKETMKSDIFSAGLTFFYWLTEGIHPFGDPLRFKRWVMADIFHNRPVNIERLSHHYAYDMIAMKMMNFQPEERPTMEDIKALTFAFKDH